MNKEGRLVILAGIDGSGKSSLLASLEHYGFVVSHWKRLRNVQLAKPLDFETPSQKVQMLSGKDRLVFIANYIKAEWNYLILPRLKQKKNVISDGFFIKFYAKECVYKRLDIDKLLSYSPLTGREFFILIDVPPLVAAERKKGIGVTPYECLHSAEDFILFQGKQRKILLSFIQNFDYVIIDGMQSKGTLLREVLYELKKRSILKR